MERRGFIGSLLAGGALGSLFSAQKAVAAEAKQGGNRGRRFHPAERPRRRHHGPQGR